MNEIYYQLNNCMIKRFKFILICLILAIMIISCEKDNEYPKKFIFDSYSTGQIKAFTKTGELTDLNIINKFIKGYEDYFWQPEHTTDGWNIEIELISESKAKITDPDSTIYFDLIRKNEILYFQFKDTMVSFGSLVNERLKFSPLYMVSYPRVTGIPDIYIPCYYIVEGDENIYFPIVSYLEKTYSNNGELLSGQGIGNLNNEFNTNHLIEMQTTLNLIDTITYQNNKIVFKEK